VISKSVSAENKKEAAINTGGFYIYSLLLAVIGG
jgi:hypothetical protein